MKVCKARMPASASALLLSPAVDRRALNKMSNDMRLFLPRYERCAYQVEHKSSPCMLHDGHIFVPPPLISHSPLPCPILFALSLAGLLSWDVSSCHVDLERELKVVTEAAPPGEELRAGDKHGCWLQMNFGRGTESPEYTSSEHCV